MFETTSETTSRSAVPVLALTHGQTIWLMAHIGLHHGGNEATFNYYVKSLRKLGVPFEAGTKNSKGQHATYDFEELMEVALALLLRVYGSLPDSIVAGLLQFRSELRSIYRQAYVDSLTPAYPDAVVTDPSGDRLVVSGLFLDLDIRHSSKGGIEFGPPRVISPFDAMERYAQSDAPARSYLPLNMRELAELIVDACQDLPAIGRGRGRRRARASRG